MSEPTIDEMLESLKYADDHYGVQNYLDIRAILEQHRYPACAPMEVGHELKSIRAFVERVNARWLQNVHVKNYDFRFYVCEELEAMQMDELAAMEKEAHG